MTRLIQTLKLYAIKYSSSVGRFLSLVITLKNVGSPIQANSNVFITVFFCQFGRKNIWKSCSYLNSTIIFSLKITKNSKSIQVIEQKSWKRRDWISIAGHRATLWGKHNVSDRRGKLPYTGIQVAGVLQLPKMSTSCCRMEQNLVRYRRGHIHTNAAKSFRCRSMRVSRCCSQCWSWSDRCTVLLPMVFRTNTQTL